MLLEKTIKTQDLINSASLQLAKQNIQTPRLDAELLLCLTLSCERIDLYKKKYEKLNETSLCLFKKYLKRRLEKEPMAHILGEKEFYGHTFFVSSATLIPRPETELLVKEAATFLQENNWAKTVLDIGTGSGCISISLALLEKKAQITAVDLSSEALKIAQKNASNLNLTKEQIIFEKNNALEESFWLSSKNYDLIISNPPYIGLEEEESLSEEVLGYEPRKALFAQKNGLEFYYIYAKYAKKLLTPQGRLFLELSPIIYDEVCQIFCTSGWRLSKTITDYGGHKRHIIVY